MQTSRANESSIVLSASASGVESPQHSTVSTDCGSLRMLSMSAYLANSDYFTVPEKVELLVNILQGLVTDLPSYLLNLILVDLQREPKWSDTALPRGRTLHACQIAFEDMRKQYHPQNRYQPVVSSSYVNIAPAAPNVGQYRSVSEHDRQRPLQPLLLPRATESPNPPVANGESPAFFRGPHIEPASEPKKRGRPSKAEVEERDRKLALEGKVYHPKKRTTKRQRLSLPPDTHGFKDEESSTPLLQTPTQRAAEPVGLSSSGKRRFRRHNIRDESPSAMASTSAEAIETTPEREPEINVVGSPSDRLLASHRDRGSVASSLSRRTQQESDSMEQHSQVESDHPT